MQINKSQHEIINVIKLLLYKKDMNLMEKVDINNDKVFLEPLLFSYFNNKKEKSFSKELLSEILQGYFLEKKPIRVKHSFNRNGIAYIPNIGYFKRVEIQPYASILKQGDFEVVKEVHPTQEKYFVEFYKGHILNSNPEHSSVWHATTATNHVKPQKPMRRLLKSIS